MNIEYSYCRSCIICEVGAGLLRFGNLQSHHAICTLILLSYCRGSTSLVCLGPSASVPLFRDAGTADVIFRFCAKGQALSSRAEFGFTSPIPFFVDHAHAGGGGRESSPLRVVKDSFRHRQKRRTHSKHLLTILTPPTNQPPCMQPR